jgi:hypothetical protein
MEITLWKGNFSLTKRTHVTGISKKKCYTKQNAVLQHSWAPKLAPELEEKLFKYYEERRNGHAVSHEMLVMSGRESTISNITKNEFVASRG